MKEADIRPAHLFERYLELSALDAKTFFFDSRRKSLPCVACGADESAASFEKHGFGYVICSHCGTLYQSPRPPIDAFEKFYRQSDSGRFWAEVFFPAVAEARRSKIFKPRVDRLAELCASKGIAVERLVDVGAGYGIFLEEWRCLFPGTDLVAIEPGQRLANRCRDSGFRVIEDVVENVSEDIGANLVVCFEVLEHVYDPVAFIGTLAKLAKPGGHIFVSTLGVDGFDIQTLWQHSNSISPPHHINFLSLQGFREAFARAGLINVDISTPGKLDVDIVRNAWQKDSAVLEENRFAKLLIADQVRGAAFQQFIAENKLSSHTWILAQRPGSTI